MHRLRSLRRGLTTLVLATAVQLRERARRVEPRLRELPLLRDFAPTAPVVTRPQPVPEPVATIAEDPEQAAHHHVRAAVAALRRADPAATDAQLHTRLRLLVNRLEQRRR